MALIVAVVHKIITPTLTLVLTLTLVYEDGDIELSEILRRRHFVPAHPVYS